MRKRILVFAQVLYALAHGLRGVVHHAFILDDEVAVVAQIVEGFQALFEVETALAERRVGFEIQNAELRGVFEVDCRKPAVQGLVARGGVQARTRPVPVVGAGVHVGLVLNQLPKHFWIPINIVGRATLLVVVKKQKQFRRKQRKRQMR